MMNDGVDPKVLYFIQDIDVNYATAIKSYLSERSYDKIRQIEEKFISNVKPNDPNAGN